MTTFRAKYMVFQVLFESIMLTEDTQMYETRSVKSYQDALSALRVGPHVPQQDRRKVPVGPDVYISSYIQE